jgi:purine nucleosidase
MNWPAVGIAPRFRIISDNDYAGDPDGLVQLAHHLLSPGVEISAVIGSRLRSGDVWNTSVTTADEAAAAAMEIARRCNREDVSVLPGSNVGMTLRTGALNSAGVDAIVCEAMRDDTTLPLFVVCGAGLGEIASAWLAEPRIADRLTVIWIGGHEHDGLADAAPGAPDLEYNLHIDPVAAQVVFNDSNLNVWQVPRNMYRSVIASRAELIVRMHDAGSLGAHLFDALGAITEKAAAWGQQMGETYVLGDSPLVSLTTLMTAFEPSPASSFYVTMPCPRIVDSGLYEARPDGRPLRVYTYIDNRLLLEDLYAKLLIHEQGQR